MCLKIEDETELTQMYLSSELRITLHLGKVFRVVSAIAIPKVEFFDVTDG